MCSNNFVTSNNNKLNIEIEQNASYGLTIQLTDDENNDAPIDISAWSFTGSIREDFNTSPVLYFSMLPHVSGSIVEAFLTDQQTWELTGSVYFYDMIAKNPEATPPETYRLLHGRIKISRGITEP